MSIEKQQFTKLVSAGASTSISNTDLANGYDLSDSFIDENNHEHGAITALWKDFFFGMQFLRNHLHRTNANLSDVAKSNFRLLHNNLLRLKSYKSHILTNYKNTSKYAETKKWLPLTNSPDMRGGIYTITHDQPLDLRFHIDNTAILSQYNDNQSSTTTSSKIHYHMLLVVNGKIEIAQNRNEHSRFTESGYESTTCTKLNQRGVHLDYLCADRDIVIRSLTPGSQFLSVELLNFHIN